MDRNIDTEVRLLSPCVTLACTTFSIGTIRWLLVTKEGCCTILLRQRSFLSPSVVAAETYTVNSLISGVRYATSCLPMFDCTIAHVMMSIPFFLSYSRYDEILICCMDAMLPIPLYRPNNGRVLVRIFTECRFMHLPRIKFAISSFTELLT